MAQEKNHEQIHPFRESEQQPDGEDRHRAGHDGRGDHRELQSPQQREERVDERHEVEDERDAVVLAGPLERGVIHRNIVNPHGGHHAPEQRHHPAVRALGAGPEVIGHGDPAVEQGEINFHRHLHARRRPAVQQRREHDARDDQQCLQGPCSGIIAGDRLPENIHCSEMCFLSRVSEWARLLNRKIGAAAPAASMKITQKVTKPLRRISCKY